MSILSLGMGNSTTVSAYQTSKTQDSATTKLQQPSSSRAVGSENTGSNYIEVMSTSRNSVTALLGSGIELGNGSMKQGGGSALEFMDTLGSLLSALASGDDETAQDAATALQKTIDELSAETEKAASTDEGPTGFIADVQALVNSVRSGDDEAISSAATSLAGGMSRVLQPPPPPPQNGGTDLQDGLGSLLSALEAGDSAAVNEAVSALQSILDGLAENDADNSSETPDASAKGGFIADVQSLLDAVKSGDSEQISTAAATLANGLGRGAATPPPMGPPPPMPSEDESTTSTETQNTADSSLDLALATLSEFMGSEGVEDGQSDTGQSAFLDSLKKLFEALQTGSNVDSRLKAVISAYTDSTA